MADIIKLDEYLEKHRHSMAKALTDALGMNAEDPNDVQYTLDMYNKASEQLISSSERHQLEMDVAAALEAGDAEAIRNLLQIRDVDTWEGQTFDGVDIAEGFNYTCEMTSEAGRNGLMDWLEENSVEYLIDNDGNFAIKCPSRKQHYHVNRYVEHLSNKWDRPSFGKSVDPDTVRKGLGNISRPALSDHVNEGDVIQGPWDKPKDPCDYHYEPQEPSSPESELKRRVSGMSSEELFDHAYRALETEMTLGQSGGNIDVAIDYITSGYEPAQNKILQGMRINLKDRYEQEFGQEFGTQQAWKHGTVGTDAIVSDEDIGEDEKDSTFHDTSSSISPLTSVDRDEDGVEKKKKKKTESVMGGKKKKSKTAKQREKEAKERIDKMGPPGSGSAAAMADATKVKKSGPQTTKKGDKGYDKKRGREKVAVDENDKIEEGVIGSMPTLGRMRELAGIQSEDCGITPDEGMMTIIVKPDPGTPKIENLPGVAEAKELMTQAFDIYNSLPEDSQGDFKDYMISQMMGSTIGLRESVEELLELRRGDEPSKPMTDDERVQLATKLREIQHALIHLIEDWKAKTMDVTKLEPVVLLLKKLTNRIGKGLI